MLSNAYCCFHFIRFSTAFRTHSSRRRLLSTCNHLASTLLRPQNWNISPPTARLLSIMACCRSQGLIDIKISNSRHHLRFKILVRSSAKTVRTARLLLFFWMRCSRRSSLYAIRTCSSSIGFDEERVGTLSKQWSY